MMPIGEVQHLVFDPGLFDGPVSLREWGEFINAEPDKLQIKPLGQPPEGYRGDYAPGSVRHADTVSSHAERTMKQYLPLQGRGPRTVFSSQCCQRELVDSQPRQGKSWISIACLSGGVEQNVCTSRPAAPSVRNGQDSVRLKGLLHATI